jgi:dTDP-glucose 4,6-dehydratase
VQRLLRDRDVDTVVHFAAESHVDRSILSSDQFVRTNVLGTQALLEACRATWQGAYDQRRFHHVSTDEVYGSLDATAPGFKETTAYAPNSPYSASKAGSDHLVRAYHHTYGLPVSMSNCSNNYGPYQFPEKLIPLMIVNAVRGKSLPVYGEGLNVRDWIHVLDHCRAVELVLRSSGAGALYNVGGRAERRNIDVVRTICAEVERAFADDRSLAGRFPDAPCARGARVADLITFVQDRPGHDFRYSVDDARIRNELGFGNETTFEAGIRSTVAWYLHNDSWWRAVLDGTYRAEQVGAG